jgi:hypothetical protein
MLSEIKENESDQTMIDDGLKPSFQPRGVKGMGIQKTTEIIAFVKSLKGAFSFYCYLFYRGIHIDYRINVEQH